MKYDPDKHLSYYLICLQMNSKMKRKIQYLLLLITIVLKTESLVTDEKQAVKYLKNLNEKMAVQKTKSAEAEWLYDSNITDENEKRMLKSREVFNDFLKQQSIETKKYDWTDFSEYNRRQFEKYAFISTAALDGEDNKQFENMLSNMERIHSTAKVCIKKKCGLDLEPELGDIMSNSTDYEELLETWVKWRDATGKKSRKYFINYYTLGNKAAALNKLPNKEFKTLVDLWLFDWEIPDFKEQIEKLLNELMPFYRKLHAYVRMKLEKQYPGKMPNDGTIPAHLLGNMWAQQWENLINTIDGLEPYPNLPKIDVTNALIEQKYTAQKLFKLSEKFFTDLGFDPMTDKFWKKSIFTKPKDREIVCHATSWDFFGKDDFRIKMCTKVNMENLCTIHHEMGHILYFMEYRDQPTVYREGANPGFHEAIGDVLALSVVTPKHLKKIGLLKLKDNGDQIDKINLNFQLKMALEKVAFLPFAYVLDKWRWDVFTGNVSSDEINSHWWRLRRKFQGISAPVKRSELDLDPGSHHHTSAGEEYSKYFGAGILQFQFHKKLCSFGQKKEPLHKCDIDGDKKAGKLLRSILRKGLSEDWPELLKDTIGTNKMDIKPMLEYFKPLEEFLDKQVKGKKGWNIL